MTPCELCAHNIDHSLTEHEFNGTDVVRAAEEILLIENAYRAKVELARFNAWAEQEAADTRMIQGMSRSEAAVWALLVFFWVVLFWAVFIR